MDMITLGIAAAGALGAVARYLVDHAVSRRWGPALPWGTFTVNVVGSLLAGVIAGLVALADVPAAVRLVAGVGFAGSFTTFSAFAHDTVRLAQAGRVPAALGNVVGNLLASLAAAGAGIGLVSVVV